MAGQSSGIVQPSFRIIGTDMVLVSLGQPLNRLLNVSKKQKQNLININDHFMSVLQCAQTSRRPFTHLLQTPFLTHLLRAEVGVAASSIPVPWNGLGVERGHNAKVLTNPVQEEAGDPQMVSHLNPLTRANLKFPLKNNKTTSATNLFQVDYTTLYPTEHIHT